MTLLVDQSTTGLEEIQRAALYVLMDDLNDALAEVEAYWHPSDAQFAARQGHEHEPTLLERVDLQHFYEGHRPSLISAPVTDYPNVAVMCARATPAPGSDLLDQMEVYTDLLIVETMVKAMDEGLCNRRAQRMATAVNLCLMGNKTLNGMVSGIDTAPTVNVSELFTRKERTAYGPHWFWQGARLEYAVRKEASHTPTSTGFFRPAATQYDIDQQ